MTIEKLPSGSYRISQTVNGKRYRVTVDHKPTEKETVVLLAEQMAKKGAVISSNLPFIHACDAYIESKSNILSPSSVRGYRSLIKQISPTLGNTSIEAITKPMVQTEINRYSASHSPKSTSNLSGFIVSILKYYGNEVGNIRLPQKEKKSPYIPTEQEVHAIFNEIKGSKYEIPIMLSALGLRRSEICALTMDDLSGNVLTVNKAKVQNERKEWVIKATKTTDSTRTVILPDYLVGIINERGFYDGHPELIYRKLTETEKKLGIQHFPLHKMRHFYASYLHKLGYSDKQIQEAGGWKDGSHIMRTVYQHAMDMDKAKKEMSESIIGLM